jgi:hypothetical protein
MDYVFSASYARPNELQLPNTPDEPGLMTNDKFAKAAYASLRWLCSGRGSSTLFSSGAFY